MCEAAASPRVAASEVASPSKSHSQAAFGFCSDFASSVTVSGAAPYAGIAVTVTGAALVSLATTWMRTVWGGAWLAADGSGTTWSSTAPSTSGTRGAIRRPSGRSRTGTVGTPTWPETVA